MSVSPPRHSPTRQARRQALLEAADRAITRDGPDISMEDIAAEAGVTKPILYRHFGDKGGLYQALAARYVDEMMDELEAALATEDDPRQRIALTIDAYLALIEREPNAYRFLMRRAIAEGAQAQATIASFQHHVAERVTEALSAEFERFGLDVTAAPIYGHGLVGMVQQAGDWWVEQDVVDRPALVRALTRWVWSGFVGLTPEG